MPYIGKNLVGILKDARASDTMTGDGSDTTLTLTDTPGSTNNVLVFLDGIRQTPVTDYWVTGRNLTFTTAPEAGVLVVALTGSASSIDPKMGSVTSSKIVDGMVGNAKIATMSASKLTGALPAISGANLTNIPTTGIDNVTSDPTISENPAGGVGTIQLNQNSGEMFVCTDATAGANVWINVGGGDGDVQPYSFQGTLEGYVAGGQPNVPGPISNTIQKFAFSSNVTGTNLGDLTRTNYLSNGTSSRTHGYSPGGLSVSTIDKFEFATSNNATSHGSLTAVRHSSGSSNSETDGFVFGGQSSSSTIEKYAFTSNTTAATHGNLTEGSNAKIGSSSITHGYVAGGYSSGLSPTFRTTIDKFAFSSNTTAADHGDLVNGRSNGSGISSVTDGYVASGGGPSSVDVTTIEKYSFSSNITASNHGDVSNNRDGLVGSSHTTHGYSSGGQQNGGSVNAAINIVDKFAYSSNTTAADHGDLVQGSYAGSGHQY